MVGHHDEIMAIDQNAKITRMRKNAFGFGTTVWRCIMKTSWQDCEVNFNNNRITAPQLIAKVMRNLCMHIEVKVDNLMQIYC